MSNRRSVIRIPWHPVYHLPGLRLLLHAPYEAARRNLSQGRTIEDRFNRADSTTTIGSADTGQTWTVHAGVFGIFTNRAYGPDTADAVATIDSAIVDSVVRARVTTIIGTANHRGLVVRGIDATNFLSVVFNGSTTFLELRKTVAGVTTLLLAGSTVWTDNVTQTLRVECTGNSIKAYVNGTLEIDHTLTGGDATQFNAASATRVGLRKVGTATSNGRIWEDFRCDPPNTTAALDSITDVSGNGFDASQSTASKRPILVWDGSRWVFRSDGVDDIMTGSASVSSSDRGGIIIATGGLASVSAGTTAWLASCDEASATRTIHIGRSTTAIDTRQVNNDTADQATGDGVLAASTPYIIGWHSSGTAYTLERNGVAETLTFSTGSNNGDWFSDTTARDNYSICARKLNAEDRFAAADFCTFIITDAVLNAADKVYLHRWLNDQNALGVTL